MPTYEIYDENSKKTLEVFFDHDPTQDEFDGVLRKERFGPYSPPKGRLYNDEELNSYLEKFVYGKGKEDSIPRRTLDTLVRRPESDWKAILDKYSAVGKEALRREARAIQGRLAEEYGSLESASKEEEKRVREAYEKGAGFFGASETGGFPVAAAPATAKLIQEELARRATQLRQMAQSQVTLPGDVFLPGGAKKTAKVGYGKRTPIEKTIPGGFFPETQQAASRTGGFIPTATALAAGLTSPENIALTAAAGPLAGLGRAGELALAAPFAAMGVPGFVESVRQRDPGAAIANALAVGLPFAHMGYSAARERLANRVSPDRLAMRSALEEVTNIGNEEAAQAARAMATLRGATEAPPERRLTLPGAPDRSVRTVPRLTTEGDLIPTSPVNVARRNPLAIPGVPEAVVPETLPRPMSALERAYAGVARGVPEDAAAAIATNRFLARAGLEPPITSPVAPRRRGTAVVEPETTPEFPGRERVEIPELRLTPKEAEPVTNIGKTAKEEKPSVPVRVEKAKQEPKVQPVSEKPAPTEAPKKRGRPRKQPEVQAGETGPATPEPTPVPSRPLPTAEAPSPAKELPTAKVETLPTATTTKRTVAKPKAGPVETKAKPERETPKAVLDAWRDYTGVNEEIRGVYGTKDYRSDNITADEQKRLNQAHTKVARAVRAEGLDPKEGEGKAMLDSLREDYKRRVTSGQPTTVRQEGKPSAVPERGAKAQVLLPKEEGPGEGVGLRRVERGEQGGETPRAKRGRPRKAEAEEKPEPVQDARDVEDKESSNVLFDSLKEGDRVSEPNAPDRVFSVKKKNARSVELEVDGKTVKISRREFAEDWDFTRKSSPPEDASITSTLGRVEPVTNIGRTSPPEGETVARPSGRYSINEKGPDPDFPFAVEKDGKVVEEYTTRADAERARDRLVLTDAEATTKANIDRLKGEVKKVGPGAGAGGGEWMSKALELGFEEVKLLAIQVGRGSIRTLREATIWVKENLPHRINDVVGLFDAARRMAPRLATQQMNVPGTSMIDVVRQAPPDAPLHEQFPAPTNLADGVRQRGNRLTFRAISHPVEAESVILATSRNSHWQGFRPADVRGGYDRRNKRAAIAQAEANGAVPFFTSPHPSVSSQYIGTDLHGNQNPATGPSSRMMVAIEYRPDGLIYHSPMLDHPSHGHRATFIDSEEVIDARSIQRVYVLSPEQIENANAHYRSFLERMDLEDPRNPFDKDPDLNAHNVNEARNLRPPADTLNRPFIDYPVVSDTGVPVRKGDKVRVGKGVIIADTERKAKIAEAVWRNNERHWETITDGVITFEKPKPEDLADKLYGLLSASQSGMVNRVANWGGGETIVDLAGHVSQSPLYEQVAGWVINTNGEISRRVHLETIAREIMREVHPAISKPDGTRWQDMFLKDSASLFVQNINGDILVHGYSALTPEQRATVYKLQREALKNYGNFTGRVYEEGIDGFGFGRFSTTVSEFLRHSDQMFRGQQYLDELTRRQETRDEAALLEEEAVFGVDEPVQLDWGEDIEAPLLPDEAEEMAGIAEAWNRYNAIVDAQMKQQLTLDDLLTNIDNLVEKKRQAVADSFRRLGAGSTGGEQISAIAELLLAESGRLALRMVKGVVDFAEWSREVTARVLSAHPDANVTEAQLRATWEQARANSGGTDAVTNHFMQRLATIDDTGDLTGELRNVVGAMVQAGELRSPEQARRTIGEVQEEAGRLLSTAEKARTTGLTEAEAAKLQFSKEAEVTAIGSLLATARRQVVEAARAYRDAGDVDKDAAWANMKLAQERVKALTLGFTQRATDAGRVLRMVQEMQVAINADPAQVEAYHSMFKDGTFSPLPPERTSVPGSKPTVTVGDVTNIDKPTVRQRARNILSYFGKNFAEGNKLVSKERMSNDWKGIQEDLKKAGLLSALPDGIVSALSPRIARLALGTIEAGIRDPQLFINAIKQGIRDLGVDPKVVDSLPVKMFDDAWTEANNKYAQVKGTGKPAMVPRRPRTKKPDLGKPQTGNKVFGLREAMLGAQWARHYFTNFDNPVTDHVYDTLAKIGGYFYESGTRNHSEWMDRMKLAVGHNVPERILNIAWNRMPEVAKANLKNSRTIKQDAIRKARAILGEDREKAFLEDLENIPETEDAAAARAYADLIRKHSGTKVSDIISSYQQTNLLSAITGFLFDATATASYQIINNYIVRATKAGIEEVTARAQGREPELYIGELPSALQGNIVGLIHGWKDFVDTVRHGATEEQQKRLDLEHYQFKGPVGAAFSLPARVRTGFNEFQRTAMAMSEAYAEAYRWARQEGHTGQALIRRRNQLVADMPPELKKVVDDYADHSAFTDKPDKALQTFYNLRRHIPGAKFAFPFIRTIYNATKRGFDFTLPLGLANPEVLKNPQKRADVLAKFLVGAAAAYVYSQVASEDEMVGPVPPEGSRERVKFYGMRKQPFSILVNGHWVPTVLAGPISTPINLAIAVKNKYRNKETGRIETDYQKALMAWANQTLSNEGFLKSYKSLFDGFHDDMSMAKWGGGMLSTLLPWVSLQRNVSDLHDPWVRDPQSVMDWLIEPVPFLTETLPIAVNREGERPFVPPDVLTQAQRPNIRYGFPQAVFPKPVPKAMLTLEDYTDPVLRMEFQDTLRDEAMERFDLPENVEKRREAYQKQRGGLPSAKFEKDVRSVVERQTATGVGRNVGPIPTAEPGRSRARRAYIEGVQKSRERRAKIPTAP